MELKRAHSLGLPYCKHTVQDKIYQHPSLAAWTIFDTLYFCHAKVYYSVIKFNNLSDIIGSKN